MISDDIEMGNLALYERGRRDLNKLPRDHGNAL